MSHRADRFGWGHGRDWDRISGLRPMFKIRVPLRGTIEYMIVIDSVLYVVTTHGVVRVPLNEETLNEERG